MLGNLSRTALSGCVAFAGIGVLVTRFHKKTGICMILGGLASAALIYKFWYQPEQIKTELGRLEEKLGCEGDGISLQSPRKASTKQNKPVVGKNPMPASGVSSSHNQQYDGVNTNVGSDDEVEFDALWNASADGMQDISLSDDDNPVPPIDFTIKPKVKEIDPSVVNWILSFVGLGQKEKAKAI